MLYRKLKSLKSLVILVIALLFLSVVAMVILVLNTAETIRIYRNNTYDVKADAYVAQIDSKVQRYSTAMNVTALNPIIRENIFRTDVEQSEMVALSKLMGQIVNATTYLLTDQDVRRHAFYAYLPRDGNNFFPLSDMEIQTWYEGYENSYSDTEYNAFIYDYLLSEYQFLMLLTINDFNTAKFEMVSDMKCYEVMRISMKSFISTPPADGNDIGAIPYLISKQDGAVVFSGDQQHEEEAGLVYTYLLENGEQDILEYRWEPKLESKYVPVIRDVPSMDAVLVVLFEERPFGSYLMDHGMLTIVTAMMAIFTVALLFLLIYYVNFSKRINHLVFSIDNFDENSARAKLPESGNYDEIGKIEFHTTLMQNRIKTLIEEEYKIKLQNISAQYEALSANINPHFLYNTLNSISAMASMEGADDTKEMILALSDMFKYSADMSRNTVPLSEEIKNIRDYLYIQEIRYNDSFVCRVDVDDSLLHCKVPKLILQPVVENCFKHGFDRTDAGAEPKEVLLSAIREEEYLKIYVMDNGRGIDSGRMEEINKLLRGEKVTQLNGDTTEIGLSNVNKRLKLLFGEQCGIQVSCVQGKYTCVKLMLRHELFEDTEGVHKCIQS